MSYSKLIGEFSQQDARLIEAWMRSKHGVLDGLSRDKFRREVRIAEKLIAADPILSERLAESFGLKEK
jgi:hypothetical protein